jgi:hypothetical protein
MLTAADLWTITVAATITLGAICAAVALWTVVSIPLAVLVGRALAAREQAEDQAEDQAATDHGDLTRRQVENAYGPLIMYGPSGEAYDGTVDLPRRGGAL